MFNYTNTFSCKYRITLYIKVNICTACTPHNYIFSKHKCENRTTASVTKKKKIIIGKYNIHQAVKILVELAHDTCPVSRTMNFYLVCEIVFMS